MTDKHHLQVWHNVTIRNNVIVEPPFYKPPPMLREDISWTVSVEKDGRLQDCGWQGVGIDGGPLGQTVAGRIWVEGSANIRHKKWNPWPQSGRGLQPYFAGTWIQL